MIINRENKKEKNKGITIVALVVTIIVLLILAGVTLATLSGENGILTKAKTAKEEYKKAQYEEAINFAKLQAHTEQGKYKIDAEKFLNRVKEILQKNELFKDARKPEENAEAWKIEDKVDGEDNKWKLTIITVEDWYYYVTEESTKYIGVEEEIKTVIDEDIKFTYDDTWTQGPIMVTIEKENPKEHEEYKIEYSYNGTTWQDYTTPVPIYRNQFIYARLTDNRGNNVTKPIAKEEITKIDKLKPEEFNINKDEAIITTDSITIIGETTDAKATEDYGQSGIETYQFSINGGIWVTNENLEQTSYTFTGLTQNTTYKIKMKAIDRAGNETKTEEIEVTTAGIPDLREEDEGNKRANVTFSHDPIGWTNGNVEVTIDTTEKGYTLQYNTGDRNREEDWKNYDIPVVMTENGSIYARLKDNANNKGEAIEHKITNIERVKPTIQIQANTTAISQTKQITITAEDTGGSELLDANYYQYYLSTSGAELLGGSWQNYRSGTPFTIGSELNGTYYLWVKQIADNAGNKSETNNGSYHVSSAYMFDNTAPYITINTNSSTTYSQSKTVEITIGDTQSGLASAANIQYGWSTSLSTTPSSYTTATLSYTAGVKSKTFTVTGGSELTGQYYLWIKPVTLKDVAGNSNTTIVKSTGLFYFDNEGPMITLLTNSSTTYSKTKDVTVVIEDWKSGVASGANVQYGWSTSTTTAPTSYTTASLSYTSGTNHTSFTAVGRSGLTGKYYLWVKPVTLKDIAGNSQTNIRKSTGTYYFDNGSPLIELSANSSITYSKSHSVTVTVEDEYSGIATGANIRYGWSTSKTTAPTSYTTASISSYIAGAKSISFTATGSGLTGRYYLWIQAVELKDVVGNSTSGEVSTGTFWFDNTGPTIGRIDVIDKARGTTNQGIVKGNEGTITLNNMTDFQSSVIGYFITNKSSTTPNINDRGWKNDFRTTTIHTLSVTPEINSIGNYYIWLKDSAGNVSRRYEVEVKEAVAQESFVNYPNIQSAINSVPDNTQKTVKLLVNNYTGEEPEISANKNIILDLNGKTLKDRVWNDGTVTITNGTINTTGKHALFNNFNGKASIENSTLTTSNYTVISSYGNLITKKAEIIGTTKGRIVIYIGKDSTETTIGEGSLVQHTGDGTCIHMRDATPSMSKLILNGATIECNNPYESKQSAVANLRCPVEVRSSNTIKNPEGGYAIATLVNWTYFGGCNYNGRILHE